jgi:hypothetical protein
MEQNDNSDDIASNNAIQAVNSSTKVLSCLSLTRSAVITKRQNPNKLADVLKICGAVLALFISQKL